MKASELVGKMAIRVKDTECRDNSYQSNPLFIEAANDTEIIVRSLKPFDRGWHETDEPVFISIKFNDDGWEHCPHATKIVLEENPKIASKQEEVKIVEALLGAMSMMMLQMLMSTLFDDLQE